jgi:hypothetical protein
LHLGSPLQSFFLNGSILYVELYRLRIPNRRRAVF